MMKVGVLLLAVAVFHWGIQARLTSFHPHVPAYSQTAKIATDKWQSSPIDLRNRYAGGNVLIWLRAPAVLLHGHIVVGTFEVRNSQLGLTAPNRYDALGADLLHLPPPRHA